MLPLHTGMAFMSTLGDILKDSGWTTIVSNAQIVRLRVAESIVSGHDVFRAKYIHQVTSSTSTSSTHGQLNRHDLQWVVFRDERQKVHFPGLCFSVENVKMELILLEFLRSIRSANFQLYMSAMDKMMPWFFCLWPQALRTIVISASLWYENVACN